MTIKNSLISIVASAAIITAITGCSSDSTTAAVAATPTAAATTVSSAVQAVDGYIYNATATAYYLAEDNASMVPIVLDTNNTTKDISTQVVTMGSSTYTLPSGTNSTVQSRIRFFTIANKASSSVGTTFTPAAYIEGSNIDGYDANDTVLNTTVLYAPASSAIVSPLTNLVYNSVGASVFGTTTAIPTTVLGELNATTYAGVEANATALATKLGLSGVDIMNADPVALAESNPTYRLVTALMKDAPATAAATLLAAATPTTLATTLSTIASVQTGTALALANTLAASAGNGAFTTADVAGMNIEKSVALGSIQSLANPVLTGKFPLNAITVDGSASSNFIATGAKVDNDAFNVDFNMSNVDGNISNTAFNVLLYIQGNKSYLASTDSNKTGAIVVKVPFDLNATKSGSTTTLAANVPAATVISYQGKSSSGAELVAKDMNATTALVNANNAISIVNTTSVSVDVDAIITGIRTAADANLTTGVTDLNNLGIADVKVYIEDTTGAIVGVTADGLNSSPLAKGSFNDFSGIISSAEALKALDLATLDLRSSNVTSGANTAPALTSLSLGTSTQTAGPVVANGNILQVDRNQSATTTSSIWAFTTTYVGGEQNNTVTLPTLSSAWLTANTVGTKATSAGTGTSDFNVTIDHNHTADVNTTYSIVVTDEFSKASTGDDNVTIFFNAYPTIAAPTTLPAGLSNFTKVNENTYTADMNVTAAQAEVGTSWTFTLGNLMGENNSTVASDINNTGLVAVITDINSTTGAGTLVINDVNTTTTADVNITINEANGALPTVVFNLTRSI